MPYLKAAAVLRQMMQRNILFKYDLAQQAGISYPLLRQAMEAGEAVDGSCVERLASFFDCGSQDITLKERSE
jgi:hypothetical protein